MKKTINVNIGGFIFHLDEDAYEKIQQYLGTLRNYFKTAEGHEDILQDIENRIAEIFKEQLANAREVVTITDVNEMIGIMGQPEAYMDEQPTPETPKDTATADAAKGPKRLYRDPDSKVLGGVCGGLGAYFGVDPVIFRLAFALLTLLWGTSVLVYIILWIAMPEARTTAEKLQMKGEKINISNIQKSVKEELEGVRQSFTGNKQKTKLAQTVEDMVEAMVGAIGVVFKFLGKALTVTFRIVGKSFIAIFMVLSLILLVCLIHGMFFGGMAHFSVDDREISLSAWQLADMLLDDPNDVMIALTGITLFLFVPLIMLVYAGIKMLFGIKHRSRWLGIGMTLIWLAGLFTCIYTGIQIGNHFRHQEKYSTEQVIPVSNGRTLTIKSSREGRDTLILKRYTHDELGKVIAGEEVCFSIKRNDRDSLVRLEIVRYARGRSWEDASHYARTINYQFAQNDTNLVFAPDILFTAGDKFRARQVDVILRLPDGQKVYLDHSIKELMHDVYNVHNLRRRQMMNKTWIMKKEGLTCLSCTPSELLPEDDDDHAHHEAAEEGDDQ